MAGVEILAENVITSIQYSYVWNVATIFFYVSAISCAILSILFAIDGDLTVIASTLLSIALMIAAIGIAYITGAEEVYDYTEYKVIVDDTVNMNDFMEKYEILDRDGKIYIVKEVTENDNT